LNSLFQKRSHKSLEKTIEAEFSRVLELGAGTGQHQAYAQHQFQEYWQSDLKISLIKVDGDMMKTPTRIISKKKYAENIDSPDNYF